MFAGMQPAEAAVVRPFTTRFTANTTGAITMTGNTSLSCPTSASGCINARTGAASTVSANNNNNYAMTFVDIDGNPATFNSSRNTLTIPSTSTVLFAGLYWGADTTAGTSGSAAPNAAQRDRVLFATPNGAGYQSIIADRVDVSPVSGGVRYQGFAEVTSLVTDARSGEYTIANVQAGQGIDRYGGWALVVAVQDINEPLRNLTIFDGYAVVQQSPAADQNVAIPVSGFLTPETGQVRTKIGVVAYEGDRGLFGDSLRLNTTSLTNSLNPSTNFFNSSLTHTNSTNTTGDPFQTNLMGLDIDTINANNVLANSASSATINLNTTNDTYFPGVVSFSTELFAPRLDLAKSGLDVNGGLLEPGDEVLYTIAATNNGDDGARNVVIEDVIPDYSTYVTGSLAIDGMSVTDAAGDDTGEMSGGPGRIVARLGSGASASNGGAMPIGSRRTVTFRVIVGSVPADDVLTNVATSTHTATTSGLALQAKSNTVILTPRLRSDLTLLKSGPREPVTVPGTAGFRLLVGNRGPSADPGVVVTDVLPGGMSAVAVTTSHGSCTTGSTVTCTIGRLDVGETAIIDIATSISSGSGTTTNVASVRGDNLDLFPNNNGASATVMLNRPPSAIDHNTTTTESTPVTVAVLVGSNDPDGDELRTVLVDDAGAGTVVNSDGTVTYTPRPGFRGADTFGYTITDGISTASATVIVTVSNASPVAVDDSAATLPATAVTVDALANDFDTNGDAIVVSAITQPTGGGATGVVVNNGDGTITYTPSPAFRGDAVFTYTITDGTDFATATITVKVPDAAPIAVDDFSSTPNATPVTIDVVSNDLDDNGDALTINATTQPAGGTATGVVVDNGDGTITFTPSPEFRGDAVFTYTITDGTDTDTANVTVAVLNAPPVAIDDDATTPFSTPVEIDVLGNDSDPNADPLSVIGLSTPSNGVVILFSTNVITYVPNPGFRGIDTFSYTVSDGSDVAVGTVTITVPNRPPIAAADNRTTSFNSPVTVPVLANDIDLNGDSLTISNVSTPENGSVIDNGDGTVTYTPNAGFVGIDTFTYTVSDGLDSSTATVTITVNSEHAPIVIPNTPGSSPSPATPPTTPGSPTPTSPTVTAPPAAVPGVGTTVAPEPTISTDETATTATPPQPVGPLAFTGGAPVPKALIAVGFVLLGVALMLAADPTRLTEF